ncbi:MAG: hypothetical protein AAF975_08480, partial [Spirochaetota bacterium]
MHVITAILSIVLFEAPVIYAFGLDTAKRSVEMILPNVLITFSLSLIVSIIIMSIICFVLLEKHLRDYRSVLERNGSTNLTAIQKREGLQSMRISQVNAILLGLAPLLCYLSLIDISDTVSMRALGVVRLNLIFITLFFGAIAGMLYGDMVQILFEPLRLAFRVPLQGNLRSTMNPLVKMSLTGLTASALILFLTMIFLDLDREINSRLVTVISTTISDPRALYGISREVQNIYTTLAAQYPLAIELMWNEASLYAEGGDSLTITTGPTSSISGMVVLFFSLIFLSWVNVFLLCRNFKMRINSIFRRVRSLLKGDENFAETISLASFDETDYFVGYLNLLTMTS